MRRVAYALAAVVIVAAAIGGGYALYKRHQGRNIRGSTVEFSTTQGPQPTPLELRQIPWPLYGFDVSRTRVGPSKLRPPFRRAWVAGGVSLLEFPPAIAYGRLFLASNNGLFMAVSARTGKRAWAYPTHRCVASSPAVSSFEGGTVYETFLNRRPCNAEGSNLDGEVIAFTAGLGKVRWRKRFGPTETSPLVANGLVYVGDWRGKVYALDEATGAVRWRFETGGKVKGGPALAGRRLFVGSYDGHVYGLDARTGKLLWRASAQARLGPTGTFYSTPATAYGRVYIGSTDGKVYSFGAASGRLRWSHGTGGYVYASPAVWNKLVFAGSYSGTFYAFDAATGDVRWSFDSHGPISGSPTVLAGVVYFATLKGRTYALDARTGRQLWTWPDGKYSPVVADQRRLYLVGYSRLYGFVPRRAR